MKKTQAILKFNSQDIKLNSNEKKVLGHLLEAASLIAPLYLQQENRKYPGENFYPKDATKSEILKAAEKDPEILSPYTVVERKNGKLVAIPYHLKYATYLKPIVEKLYKAASLTTDREFAERLEYQARALEEGSYDEVKIANLRLSSTRFNVVIGPIERYDDTLFFIKTAYQAWVGIRDDIDTKRAESYKEIILSSRRRILMPSEKVDYYDKVRIRIDNLIMYSGRIARTIPVGINLPNDPILMENYGSLITVFKQSNEYRVKSEILPAFNKIFSSSFKEQFSEEDLISGSLYGSVLHELAHTYLRYRHSERNLQDLFPIIDELGASVMGIKVCGSLLLKDIISTKHLESIMIAFMARCFYLVLQDKTNLARVHYVTGAAVFINYLLESGAVKEEGGISWPNFTKMFVSLGDLATILERILSLGTREDAEAFISKYNNIKGLQRFG